MLCRWEGRCRGPDTVQLTVLLTLALLKASYCLTNSEELMHLPTPDGVTCDIRDTTCITPGAAHRERFDQRLSGSVLSPVRVSSPSSAVGGDSSASRPHRAAPS